MANVLVSPEVQRQIDRLPRVIRARVWQLLKRLDKWPEISGAKPLRGNLAGRYRPEPEITDSSSALKERISSSNRLVTGQASTRSEDVIREAIMIQGKRCVAIEERELRSLGMLGGQGVALTPLSAGR